MPEGHHVDGVFGDIKTEWDTRLGLIYFKYNQWVCSYGMKLVDISDQLQIRLEFETSFSATFCITDYQILAFDDLHSANSYVNSRAFTLPYKED